MLAKRPAQRAGQDADPLKVEIAKAREHRLDETVAEDLLFEVIGVDEHRRVQRVEGGDSQFVEDARPGPPEVGLPAFTSRIRLTSAMPSRPLPYSLSHLICRRPGDAPDGLVERLQLAELAVHVGHREDLRLDGFLPAGAVRAVRAAAGQQGDGEE